MESTRKASKQAETTTEQAQQVSKEINGETVDFLPPAKLEKLETETDDLDLDRTPAVKTLSQVAKKTVLSDDASVMALLTAAENAGQEHQTKVEDAEYYTPTEGEVKNVIAYGFIQTTIEKKEVKCLCFVDKHNKQYITGAKVLVNACEKLENEFPVALRIICTGKKQGEFGKYFTFDIFKL